MYDKSAYLEAKKTLDEIRKNNDILFRLGLFHLMDVGRRCLTEESVRETCAEIMDDDRYKIKENKDGSRSIPIMTAEFSSEIVKTAYEISKVDVHFLLKYIADNIDDYVFIDEDDDEDYESISD